MKKLILLAVISLFSNIGFAEIQTGSDLARFVATNVIQHTPIQLWKTSDCERSNDLFQQIECVAQNTLVTVGGLELEANDTISSTNEEVWLEYFDPEQNCILSIKFDLEKSQVILVNKWSCAGIPLDTEFN